MKIPNKTHTPKFSGSDADKADQLGEAYVEAASTAKGAEEVKLAARNNIFEFVKTGAKSAATRGKRFTVIGTKFEIGYSVSDPSPRVDLALAKQHIPKAIYQKLLSLQIDEEKLSEAIKNNLITADIMKAITVVPAPTESVYVQDLAKQIEKTSKTAKTPAKKTTIG
jgi:hypothetical protein